MFFISFLGLSLLIESNKSLAKLPLFLKYVYDKAPRKFVHRICKLGFVSEVGIFHTNFAINITDHFLI